MTKYLLGSRWYNLLHAKYVEQYSQVEDTIAVSARSGPRIQKTKKAPERIILRQGIVTIPQRDVHVETNKSRVSEQLTLKDYRNYGCSDHPQQSGPHSGGKRIVKEESPRPQTPVQRRQPEISAAMGTDMPEHSCRSSLDSGFSDHSIFTNSPQHSSGEGSNIISSYTHRIRRNICTNRN